MAYTYYTQLPDGINVGYETLKAPGALYARPRVHLKTGSVTGLEVLVLPDGNTERADAPDENLSIAHLEELFGLTRTWIKEGVDMLPVSVHIGEGDLCDTEFIKCLLEIKKNCDVPFGIIEIELKGGDLKFKDDYDAEQIGLLRKAGFSFSMHNFGEGVSLIDVLRRYPLDLLKFRLDMFGHSLPAEKERSMLTHIVRMAKTLDIPVLCEGISSQEQAEAAKLTESDMGSGDYYGRPVPASRFYSVYCRGNAD